ncbi:MAG: ABC transporter substrate-binding protein [Candidatus Acetothermia bacterium]
MRYLKIWIVFSLALVILAVSVSSEPASTRKVELLMDWVPNTNHTGIYVAMDKGWYEEAGVQLELIEPAGEVSVEKVVGAGKADFGISFQEWATSAMAEGVPIVSLAAVIQENTSGFASLKEKGLERPRDFAGATYGGWGLPIEKEILKALVEGDGGDFPELNFVNIGKGDLLTMLAQEKFDIAWIYYGWDGIQAELRGLELNLVMLKDYQELVPNYYTPIIISSREYVEQNTEIVEDFMAATSRGYSFAIENPDEAAEILLEYTPEADPQLVKNSQEWLSPRYQEDAPYWGRQELSVWKEFGNWMSDRGLIEGEFDPERAFTNEFLPETKAENEEQ